MKKSGAKSSSGRGNHNGDGRAEDPTCSVCMSDEFYEDEQGGMICVACGTQSQDFLAEGFDEDDLAVYGGGTGNIVTLKNASGKGLNTVEESKTKKVDLVPDVLEALKLYQFVMQMVFDACLAVSNKASSNTSEKDMNESNALYRNTLKSVWLDYLNRWNSDHTLEPQYQQSYTESSQNDKRARFRSVRKCSVGCGFTRSAKYQCKCKDAGTALGHPLFPSKQLILGFVYLTYRVMRSDVLVSDMVRWCEAGIVPYLNLWESIPQKWRDSVKVDMKWFYDTTNKRVSLTPSSVLFHACSIAQVIRIDPAVYQLSAEPLITLEGYTTAGLAHKRNRTELPPLNAPLVAHKIITSLGLPSVVWENYVKITQLCSGGTPINHANMLEQHHELYIMSVIITAIKCCPNWIEWSLVKSDYSDTHSADIKHPINHPVAPMPEQIHDMSTLTRAELPALLAQIRRINQLHTLHTDTHKTQFLYNNAVFTALGGDAEKLNKGEGQYTGSNNENDLHRQAQQSQYSQYSQYSQSSYHSIQNHNVHATRSLHTAEVPHFHRTTCTDTTLSMNNTVLHGEGMITEDLSLKDRRLLNFMNGIEPQPRGKKTDHTQKAAYIAYGRYDSDRTSLHHIPYITLLERCSKYLYVNVQLLHNLVTDLEKQIVNLAFMGTVDISTAVSTRTKSGSSRNKNGHQEVHQYNAADALSLDDIGYAYSKRGTTKAERKMHKYRLKYAQLLPEAQKQGLATLQNTTNKRKHNAISQNTDNTDGYSSEDSRESYQSVTNNRGNKSGTSSTSGPIQPFVFDPCAGCADVDNLFGPTNVIHRVDLPAGKRTKKAKISPESTVDLANTTSVDPTATASSTITNNTHNTNTPKSSSYLDAYESAGASGYDTDANEDNNCTPSASPLPLEFDLLHAYTASQAGERTPPISEITYSRTPFSAIRPTFNNTVTTGNRLPDAHIFSTSGVSLVEKQPKKRTNTPHVAAMEALDRLVSAQDSASDSDIQSAEDSEESDHDSEIDTFGNSDTPITAASKIRKKKVTNGVGSRAGNANSVPTGSMVNSPSMNPHPVATGVSHSTPASLGASGGGMSLLARAIYGSGATSSNPAVPTTPATVISAQITSGVHNSVALRPVVALKRPRVQFQH